MAVMELVKTGHITTNVVHLSQWRHFRLLSRGVSYSNKQLSNQYDQGRNYQRSVKEQSYGYELDGGRGYDSVYPFLRLPCRYMTCGSEEA